MADTEPTRRHADTPARAPLPLTDPAALPTLAPEWAALHANVGAAPFVHPAWHETWLRHFGEAADAVFLAVREAPARRRRGAAGTDASDDADDGGSGVPGGGAGEEPPEAVPPLRGVMALDLSTPGAAITLGDTNVRDYGGPLAAPGYEEMVARGVLEWLTEDMTGSLELRGIPAGSAIERAFATVADGLGWACETVVEAVAPVVALPGSFEEYVQGLAKRDRHELRRKLRNLEAAGTVTFERTSAPDGVAARMDALLAMMRASHPGKAAFLTPAMEAFFRDLAGTFGGLGMAALETMRLDGVPVATQFTFDVGEVTYLYNSGFDPERANLAAGLLSKALSVRAAIERGQRTYDFLRGDEEYKSDLGGVARDVMTLRLTFRA